MTDAARPRFPYVLTVVTVLALALLLTLGVWQAQRLQWKLDLIARSEAAARQAPVPLADALALEDPEFRQAIVTCRGLNTAPFVELQTIEDGDAGVRLISACPIEGRGTILVDRGFLPAEVAERPAVRADAAMPVVIAGVVRRATEPNAMTPPPSGQVFYGRDQMAMAKALGVAGPVSPYTVYATTSANPELTALRPVAPPAAFSNNHLGYALTWFGLAAVLVGFYAAVMVRRYRSS
ncbi:SURF1 family protein [Brevundimonas naejangsanensis]|uniref:SURF1 family protein n=1 Tax=Brevundimonas naejangsanensis TaxID=588932 RepID=UPI00106BF934|nr:SURF1 family protein [Brevundimonas naejangsanensis]QBQ48846.1 SURF1 family protein [Brevundimonas naejangsanensis]